MLVDHSRIADLKRRLQADPTSIAFAQLAEEYRRARQFEEAVAVCREGLRRHPGYLSARITLGRALTELGDIKEAEREFEYVLRTAPDNLPALRGLAEISERQGNLHRALGFYRRALELARYDPDLDETVRAIAEELDRATPRASDEGLSFQQARDELLEAPSRVPYVPSKTKVDFEQVLQSLGYEPNAPAPPIVEAWLSGQPPAIAPEPPRAEEAASSASSLGPDLLEQLEHDLRQLAQRPPGLRDPSEVDQAVLAELERWLEAIARLREARASASRAHAGVANAFARPVPADVQQARP